MQTAARPYLAAGIALVGASVIAVSPVAPAAPQQLHLPVALAAAIDNPVTVFEPVATEVQSFITDVVERQTTNPAPIARQLVENAIAGYQVAMTTPPVWQIAQALADAVVAAQNFGPNLAALGETTSAAGTVISESLSALAAGLPDGLQAAAAKIAAGDAGGALDGLVQSGMQPVINILVFAVNPEINAIGHVLNVPQPIIDATSETAMGLVIGLAAATVGVGGDLPGFPRALLKQAIVGAQDVANAVGTRDPIQVVNAVQHGIADFATSAVYQAHTAVSMANYIEDTYANALKQIAPKPTLPDPVGQLTAASPAALSATVTPAEKSVETTDPAPTAEAAKASDAASASDSAAGNAAAGSGSDAGKAATKTGDKATAKSATKKAATSIKAVRDQVKSAVGKLTSGVKKDKAGAGKKADTSSDSAKDSATK